MATIKSYSDLQQSKKLAEILPLESADMWWLYVASQGKHIAMMYEEPDPHYIARMESYGIKDCAIRCWSLAALLRYLSEIKHQEYTPTLFPSEGKWILHFVEYGYGTVCEVSYDNPVDACVAMIEKLHELNLL